MELSADAVWQECLQIIRDNISRQSFKTWFEPLTAEKLVEEDNETRLTVKLPSRFYYEWLEEHYFGLLSKTIMKVLGPQGRLFYNIVIEKDDTESGYEGSSMQLPSRKPANEQPPVQRNMGHAPPGQPHIQMPQIGHKCQLAHTFATIPDTLQGFTHLWHQSCLIWGMQLARRASQ